MIGTQITITNHETGESVILNDHTNPNSVIALQNFPTMESDVRANNQSRIGAHGEFRLPYYYSGKSVVLQGVILGTSEADVWTNKRKLDSIFALSKKGTPQYTGSDTPINNATLRIEYTDPTGESVFIDGTPLQSVSYNRDMLNRLQLSFQVIVRSAIPYLIAKDETTISETGSLGENVTGLKLPMRLFTQLQNEYTQGEVTIEVTTKAFAIITLYGSDAGIILEPTITNLTNGDTMTINKPLLGSGSFFKIDGFKKTVEDQGGASVTSFITGDYLQLETGENKLVYTATKI